MCSRPNQRSSSTAVSVRTNFLLVPPETGEDRRYIVLHQCTEHQLVGLDVSARRLTYFPIQLKESIKVQSRLYQSRLTSTGDQQPLQVPFIYRLPLDPKLGYTLQRPLI